MSKILENISLKFILGTSIIALFLTTVILIIIRISGFENPGSGALMMVTYFTIHSNIFVFISTILILLKKQSKTIDRFIYITAIDIAITCIIYFVILLPIMIEVTAIQILTHGIIPPLFLLYYYVSHRTSVTQKSMLIALIHPFVYVLFVYLVVQPLYGDYLFSLYPNEIDSYVYPFLNPNYFDYGFLGVMTTNLLILMPFVLIISFVILRTKVKIDSYLNRV